MIYKDILENAIKIIGDTEIDINVNSEKRTKLINCGNTIYSELMEKRLCPYTVKELALTDTLDMHPMLNVNTLAYGVASEYFYRVGLLDNAAFYSNRYDGSINIIIRKQKAMDLKGKRFI